MGPSLWLTALEQGVQWGQASQQCASSCNARKPFSAENVDCDTNGHLMGIWCWTPSEAAAGFRNTKYVLSSGPGQPQYNSVQQRTLDPWIPCSWFAHTWVDGSKGADRGCLRLTSFQLRREEVCCCKGFWRWWGSWKPIAGLGHSPSQTFTEAGGITSWFTLVKGKHKWHVRAAISKETGSKNHTSLLSPGCCSLTVSKEIDRTLITVLHKGIKLRQSWQLLEHAKYRCWH